MLMHQNLVQRMKKCNNFMMILKEQWPIVTQNVGSLQEILKQKLEQKQKMKTLKAWELGNRGKK